MQFLFLYRDTTNIASFWQKMVMPAELKRCAMWFEYLLGLL